MDTKPHADTLGMVVAGGAMLGAAAVAVVLGILGFPGGYAFAAVIGLWGVLYTAVGLAGWADDRRKRP